MVRSRRLAPIDDKEHVHICFVLAPRFTLLPFAGFIDTLRYAADVADRSRQVYCKWSIVTKGGRPAVSSCGARISPLRSEGPDEAYDYVVVVGGTLPYCLDLGGTIYSFLQGCRKQDVILIGLCTGSFILAKAGLMNERKCAVHLIHKPDLEAMFPDVRPVTKETYIVDDNIITCPGGTAAIDLATEIISHHFGKARAVKGLRAMLVDHHRAAHHLPNRSHERLEVCGNPHVERTIKLMKTHIESQKTIDAVAREIGVSRSHLDRVFFGYAGMTPYKYWRKMRLEHAHWMICDTNRDTTNIAYQCGFYDSAHFCRSFKRVYGETPMSLRKRNRNVLNLRQDEYVA